MGIFGKNQPTNPTWAAGPDSKPQATGLVDMRKAASVSLHKHGVNGKEVKVYAAFDHSGSMQGHYASGAVQRLTEQVLALGVELDDDGSVEAWYFDDDVSDQYTISLDSSGSGDSYVGWVNRTHSKRRWGLTNYAAPIKAIARFHEKHGGGLPGLVVFQTDGSPYTGRGDARADAKKALVKVSGLNLFFAFVGFGTRQSVDFLFQLDEISGRTRDNASAYVVQDPALSSDADLYDGVLGEFVGQFLPQVL